MAESTLSPALRQRLAIPMAITPARFALGVDRLDAKLGGGLMAARLHELWPATAADGPSAAGVALMLAACVAPTGTIVWIAEEPGRRQGQVHAPGFRELGVDPARLLFVTTPDARALMQAAGDVVRSPGIAAAVIAPARGDRLLDLTATRRLTLFAEYAGTTAILLRPSDPGQPSAAATRWQVAAAPSVALEADAPGHPAFLLDLVRQRGGPPAPGWRLEWRRDHGRFAPLSGTIPAVAGGRHMAA